MIVALGAPAFARRATLVTAIVTVAVLAMTIASIGFRPDGSEWAVWRPATGVAVGIAAWYSPRGAAQIAVAAGLGTFLGSAIMGRDLALCIGAALTAALEAWIASRVLQGRTGRVPVLDDWVGLRRMFVAAGAVGAVTAVGLGVTAAVGLGWSEVAPSLLTTVPTHVSGMLIVSPLFFSAPPPLARPSLLEAILQWTVLVVSVVTVFRLTEGLPVAYVVIPALIWGATRTPYRHFMVQLVTASLAISVFTSNSYGPFGRDDFADFAPLFAGTFSVTVAVIAYTLIAGSARVRTLRALLDAQAEVYQESIESSAIGIGVVSAGATALHLSDVNAAGRAILGLETEASIDILSVLTDESTRVVKDAMGALDVEHSTSWSGPIIELRAGRFLEPSLVALSPLPVVPGLSTPPERRASLQFIDVTMRERERAQQAAELQRAADIQSALTPPIDISVPHYRFAARSISTRGIGGDFYDCRARADGFVVTLGDVMGKGIGPALVASGLKMALRLENANHPPAQALSRVARAVEGDLSDASVFATTFIARVDASDGRVRYVDAGHGLAIICRADAPPLQLVSRGIPVGVLVDSTWTEHSAHVSPGDTLVIFSDGILELFDGSLTIFDEIARLNRESHSPEELIDRLFSSVDSEALADDVTAIVIRHELVG